jgi:hypothetical protein
MATNTTDVLIETLMDWRVEVLFGMPGAGINGMMEALAGPFEPPMPPKVTMQQAMDFTKSLAKGEPDREKIALTALGDQVRELFWPQAQGQR